MSHRRYGIKVGPNPVCNYFLVTIRTRSEKNSRVNSHQTCLSINRLWHELCDMLRRLVGTTAPGHHDCSNKIRLRKSGTTAISFWAHSTNLRLA
ncbi:hypothetical protein TNCV_4702501 [Trichonephila clavipes]|nr:hypothetical protein TNCV_4702501 [Trichonephila clavipes]